MLFKVYKGEKTHFSCLKGDRNVTAQKQAAAVMNFHDSVVIQVT